MEGKIPKGRVAVLGLGITGVTTVKNFVELGFKVVGFDQNPYIGGLWQCTTDPNQTSVLKTTVTNISKQVSCYTDFAFPDVDPNYPNGEQVTAYINAYASHFKIRDNFRLSTKVLKLDRSPDDTHWNIETIAPDSKVTTESFDRVIVCNGPFSKAISPKFKEQDSFKGRIIHAQAFKEPQDFAGKRVLVVGLSQTGGDTAVELAGVAAKVFLSHRAGGRIITRGKEGARPTEHRATRRTSSLGQSFAKSFPGLSAYLLSFAVEKMMRSNFPNIQPSWGLLPGPPILNSPPVMNDFIISKFSDGSVTPVRGIKRFLPSTDPAAKSSDIELADGTILSSIDAVILCTGYCTDFSFCAPSADPTIFPTPEWDQSPHGIGLEYPRLYQGLLSTKHPDSLAFIGPYRGHSFAAFSNADLNSQAIAQIWAGRYPSPSQEAMEKWCDNNYQRALKEIKTGRVAKVGSGAKDLERWLNDAAGNELNQKIGWGWEAWKFWWKDPKLYRLVIDGLNTPFAYRLFEGRQGARPKWEGARDAIFKVNGKELKSTSVKE